MKNSRKLTFLLLLMGALIVKQSCSPPNNPSDQLIPNEGSWLFHMDLKKALLPFEAQLINMGDRYELKIFNSEEEILLDDVIVRNDSLIANMPVFESTFYLKVHSTDSMSGVWVNYYKSEDYQIDVWARKSDKERFEKPSQTNTSRRLFKKYEVTFSPGTEDEYKAIGLFEQNGARVSGTFATETGDYRFLEGAVVGDSLYLSTFDGSHAFYFSAEISDSALSGVFISGIHFEENWTAKVNSEFELRDPEKLTSSSDSSSISFKLENIKGETVSLDNEQFNGKVKLIQIMGSWCPNCLDESIYLNDLMSRYASKEFEVIGIAFERTRQKERALKNLIRLKEKYDLNYTLLLGGFDRSHHPTDIFPMLNHIMSYPTTLYLDKKNRIRKVYTGFYGPGTGELYNEYKLQTESFIDSLLVEKY